MRKGISKEYLGYIDRLLIVYR